MDFTDDILKDMYSSLKNNEKYSYWYYGFSLKKEKKNIKFVICRKGVLNGCRL